MGRLGALLHAENEESGQGDNADEALAIYDEQGARAAIHHLSQWHYPGEHDSSDELGHGERDTVVKHAGYVLTVNTGIGYIGLEFDTTYKERGERMKRARGESMSTERTVTGYEIVDHGEDGASYFPGCGVAFTSFDSVSTGCGDSARAALEDALEQSVCGEDVWPSELTAEIEALLLTYSEDPIDCGESDEWYYYMSVRVKYAAQEDSHE